MAGKWLKVLLLGAVLAMSADAKHCRRKTPRPTVTPVPSVTSPAPAGTVTAAPIPTTTSVPSTNSPTTSTPSATTSAPSATTSAPSPTNATTPSTPAGTDEAGTSTGGGIGIKMCQLPQFNLQKAAKDYPAMASAINTVLKNGPAAWYTDNMAAKDVANTLTAIKGCGASDTVLVVVYGLPNKDCAAGLSNHGSNTDAASYKTFVQNLATAVGNRNAIYVMEPDAVGLSQDGNCGVKNNYIENIAAGVEILSKNANANIYMDIGYWNLQDDRLNGIQAKIIKQMGKTGRIKGIALNTSNYRPNKEISQLCANFQKAYGDSTNFKCIIDTSRNFVENPPSTDWCNQLWAGIGHPPTKNTGFSNLEYMMWLKPVGESDGTCNGGPGAGEFFKDGFVKWWNQGYYVKTAGMAKL